MLLKSLQFTLQVQVNFYKKLCLLVQPLFIDKFPQKLFYTKYIANLILKFSFIHQMLIIYHEDAAICIN